MGSTLHSSNCGLKIFGEKYSRKFPKANLEFAMNVQATVFIAFTYIRNYK